MYTFSVFIYLCFVTSHIFSPILFCVYLLMFCDVTYIFTYTFLCLFYMCFMTSSAYVFVTCHLYFHLYFSVFLSLCFVTPFFAIVYPIFLLYFPPFYPIFTLFLPYFLPFFRYTFPLYLSPLNSYFLPKGPHKRDSGNPFI